MTPPMYQRVRTLLENAGLTTGYTIQYLLWSDTGKQGDRFIVFRPNGGTPPDRDMAAEHYVMVDVISSTADGDYAKTEADTQAIIDYIQQHPISDPCVGSITPMGGMPSPILTTEGRMVWRLQFACLFG